MTVLVWLGAIGSAAALTYDLSRPLVVSEAGPSPPMPPPPTLPAAPDALDATAVATREIKGIARVHRPAPASSAPLRTPRDIAKMHCSEWRDLSAGSGRVQICD
jgi:hypothetical protein